MGKLIESFYISRFCFFSFHRWSQQEKEEENRGDRKHFLRSLCLATYGTTWKSYRYGSWGARIASAEWIAGNATKLIRDNCIVIFFFCNCYVEIVGTFRCGQSRYPICKFNRATNKSVIRRWIHLRKLKILTAVQPEILSKG